MKTKIKRTVPILVIIVVMTISCRDPYNDELDKSKLNFAQNDTPVATELDNWLLNNFTKPYNIEVQYRWDGSEVSVFRTLVPPSTGKVETIMNVVKDVWILPYTNSEAGEAFLKKFAPKQFVLIGSPNYNPGGTITLGTAEGGRKIVLFDINNFSNSDRSTIKEQMHTVHHEFAHILHQNILYSSEFKEITKGAYNADWSNVDLFDAQADGFITTYSMSAPDEDFVEMIATMLTEGKKGFDRIVCSIPSAEAQALIRRKEQLVVSYFSDVYKIDFYKLQQRVEVAIDNYAPKSLIHDLGFRMGQNFYGIKIDPAQQPALPVAFKNIYDDASTQMQSLNYTLDYILVVLFGSNDNAVILYRYHNDADGYFANFFYDYNITIVGEKPIATLSRSGKNIAHASIENALAPLTGYFENNTFFFDWVASDQCEPALGGIYPQEIPGAFSFGRLVTWPNGFRN